MQPLLREPETIFYTQYGSSRLPSPSGVGCGGPRAPQHMQEVRRCALRHESMLELHRLEAPGLALGAEGLRALRHAHVGRVPQLDASVAVQESRKTYAAFRLSSAACLRGSLLLTLHEVEKKRPPFPLLTTHATNRSNNKIPMHEAF